MSMRSKERSRFPSTHVSGVTLIELMVTLSVIAITLALAVPSFTDFKDKRGIRKGAEELISFINYAQSAAVKMNQEVTVSWDWGLADDTYEWSFCIGATDVEDATCDCFSENACMVDGDELRLVGSDPDIISRNLVKGSFTFDPVRGMVINPSPSSSYIFNDTYLFWIRSGSFEAWGGDETAAAYSIRSRLNVTGRLESCLHTNQYFTQLAGGLPKC